MWKAIKDRPGSWHIEYNDQVQPFGAIFFNERGDIGKLVKRAVAQLNAGKRVVQGVRDLYEVVMTPSGVADINLVRTEPAQMVQMWKCHDCGHSFTK
jgi:hypothetical protein